MEKNNLHVKLEKYKWKVKKVGFLEVVIEPEGIKIKEEKVKVVLNCSALKGVKNIQKFLELASYYWQFIKNFAKFARLLHELVTRAEVGIEREV